MTDCKYDSSFSAFFRNLTTCSGSSRFMSLGHPPSVWQIPRSAYSTRTVLAYYRKKKLHFTDYSVPCWNVLRVRKQNLIETKNKTTKILMEHHTRQQLKCGEQNFIQVSEVRGSFGGFTFRS